MKTKVMQLGPFKAWMATLPMALGVPSIVWLIVDRAHFGSGALMVIGIMMLVHFSAYLVTGLPIFLCLYRETNSPIWTPVIGVPVGALLGMIAYFLTFAFLSGYRQSVLLDPYFYVVGVGYGVATAIAALLHRPTRQ